MSPTSTAESYQRLRELVLSGIWGPDEPLREESVAQLLGTSRTPVRDALRRLESDGLVRITPRRGARVVSHSAAEVDAIFDLRALLEGHAARRAAETGGCGDLAELERLANAMEEELAANGPTAEVTRLNLAFHRHIHDGSGNPLLTHLLESVIATSLVHSAFASYDAQERERSVRHHRELIEAIRARDGGWAGSVMAGHIRAAHHVIRRTREEGPTP
ncbi:GntR family transcriptional regulator [Ornithinicoccus halotolerans]|uniref:GntR family transcriptional regulator n=1 Tax=Ornithinicoccus halotolerans TaxID=1748220 RepID=UPI001885E0F8|nr:GntR family transcriptional regulator [Ornithinicoccus halotolerans]